jgi:hypothetical protein
MQRVYIYISFNVDVNLMAFFYFKGGMGIGNVVLNSVERYDIDENKWILVASMQQVRCNLSLIACNSKLYAIGGRVSLIIIIYVFI